MRTSSRRRAGTHGHRRPADTQTRRSGSTRASQRTSSPSLGGAGRGLAAARRPRGVCPGQTCSPRPAARPLGEQVSAAPPPLPLYASSALPRLQNLRPSGATGPLLQLSCLSQPRPSPTESGPGPERGQPPETEMKPSPAAASVLRDTLPPSVPNPPPPPPSTQYLGSRPGETDPCSPQRVGWASSRAPLLVPEGGPGQEGTATGGTQRDLSTYS